MAPKISQLAKLTSPRVHAAVPRERLFRLLDAQRTCPCIWIVSPPGAGKTTLAATYLAEAKLPAIWYQLDSGDSDPATFFHYLREAARRASRKRRPLPLLTPEYRDDLPGFGRRFFRGLFMRLAAGAVIVLDNQHEVAPESRLHETLAAAIEEVPPNANLLVLSRADPPREMARVRLSGKLVVVGWDQLRLTVEETAAIAAARGDADGSTAQLLHQQANGWAAGVTLLLGGMRDDGAPQTGRDGWSLEAIFDYFASQIFDAAPREVRELLMACALPPQASVELAVALTGNSDAGAVLQSFYQRHLFVDRRAGQPPVYRFHALFRGFLQERAERELGTARTHELKLAAATLMAESAQEEDAFALFVDAGAHRRAADLFVRLAPGLIGQGRWRTLREWHALLPAQLGRSIPWVAYWLGRALAAVDPPAARASLEPAWQAFVEQGDAHGQLRAAAGMLEALAFELRHLKQMDPWIERVVNLLAEGRVLAAPEDELQVHTALIAALIYRDPDHPMLSECVRRVEALLGEPSDPNLRLGTASILQMYAQTVADRQACEIAAQEARPLLGSPQVSAPRAAFYWASEGYSHYAFCHYDEAIACCAQAQQIALEHGLHDWALTAGTWRGLAERRAGRFEAAEATLAQLEPLRKPATGLRVANYQMLRAGLALDRGDTERGLAYGQEARAAGEQSGQYLHAVLVGSVVANCLLAAGRCADAAAFLEWGRAYVRGPTTGHILGVFELLEAWRAQREGDAGRRNAHLRRALVHARDERALVRMRWHLNVLSELLPVALANGIEAQTAAELAQRLDIVPGSPVAESWPWAVKVYTLGRFELLLHGRAPEFGRKLPRKSLALLQAIVALGGTDVPEARLSEALWPDQDGDAAYRALCSALHRLRKLLGDNSAIRQSGGRLSLNRERCWVDALAFEHALQDGESEGEGLHERGQAGLALYRGPFLAQEDGAAWAVAMRERLRTKFVQAVGAAAREREQAGAFESAIDYYRRGIDADYLIEAFYQGLMRCYARLDREPEASSTYRRLRQTLSVVLGVAPSEATDRLYRQLRLAG